MSREEKKIVTSDEPAVQQALAHFCRHLLVLAGTYQPIDESGAATGPAEFFAFSGVVLSVRGLWSLLTAGHILKDIDGKLAQRRMRLTSCVLADHFGLNVVSHDPIPFDYEAAPRSWADEDGFDAGLVSLRPYYRALLEKNGIVPIAEENWIHQHSVEFDRHIMLGLPRAFIESNRRRTANGEQIVGSVAPTMISVQKLDTAPADIPPTKSPRFVGQLSSQVPLQDIDGMSGGPIFGFQKGRNDRYWIVAIQSSWIRSRRLTFGCPITVIGELLESVLEESLRST